MTPAISKSRSISMSQLMLGMIVGIVLITAISIMLFARQETTRTILAIEDRHARNFVDTVTLAIETEYRSLLFHEERALAMRKAQLRDFVGIALAITEYYHQEALAGRRTQREAQDEAKERLRQLRYDNGNGYVWVHTIDPTRPEAVMHPTMPAIEGTKGADPVFYEATGTGQHLLDVMNAAIGPEGAGFLEYRWPKPGPEGLSSFQPKLSYLALFADWGWVIGSGTYIDDIEKEIQTRREAIINELKDTIAHVRIGENGYLFIFDGNRNMIVHPVLAGMAAAQMADPDEKSRLMDEQMAAARTPGAVHEYLYEKPGHKDGLRFRKKTYANYFAPLDWYIVAGVYLDEIEIPARDLGRKIILLTVFFCGIAVVMALLAAKVLTKPLKLLAATARQMEEEGLEGVKIPISGPRETRELGLTMRRMALSVQRGQRALRESEERYRSIIENANDAIVIIGDNLVIDCNAKTTELFGAARTEIIGGAPWNGAPPTQPDGQESKAVMEAQIRMALGGSPQFFEWRGQRTDGTAFDGEVLLFLVKIAGEDYVTAFVRDITARKKAEEQQRNFEKSLRQAQKMEALGTLAGGISHDFNNILTGIIGYGELAVDDLPDAGKVREHLDAMLAAADRARSLVRQILTFSRRVETETTPLEPHLIIKEALKLLRSSIPSSIEIVQDIDAAAGFIMADPAQIHQIIMNLCTNAYGAMRESGGIIAVRLDTITVGADNVSSYPELQAGSFVRITVSDNGCGMDSATLSHVFEPFFTTKPKGEGTGLGLSTVHGIVKAMQGAITVYSEPDRGTTFHIYLPRSEQAAPERSEAEGAAIPGHGEHILLVDDEKPILVVGSKMLTRLGYAVTIRIDPREALETFANNPQGFDLVITDQAMPGMTGSELAAAIRRIRPDIPIVMASGFSRNVSDKWMSEAGIGHFIEKPFQKNNISIIVSEALKTAGRQQT